MLFFSFQLFVTHMSVVSEISIFVMFKMKMLFHFRMLFKPVHTLSGVYIYTYTIKHFMYICYACYKKLLLINTP